MHQTRHVCYVLSYYFPLYVRTGTFLAALELSPNTKLHTAINTRTGFARYIETLLKLIWARWRYKPELYVLGFRGHELFWLVRLLTWGKPLVFDELMSPTESLLNEKHRLRRDGLMAKLIHRYERSVLKWSEHVLADTESHKKFLVECFGLSAAKVSVVPMSADEARFQPRGKGVPTSESRFEVLFYGSFLPLHGVDVILEAAALLCDLPITFSLIGGHRIDLSAFHRSIERLNLSRVRHISWIPYDQLPSHIARVHLCLGGPFGNTDQAQRIVTGKTCQSLAMAKPTMIGRTEVEMGFVHRRNCLLVPQANSQALAREIRWASENPTPLQTIGQNGYQLYRQQFSIDEKRKRLEHIIDGVLQRESSSGCGATA